MASSRKKVKSTLPIIAVLVVVAVLLLIAILTENRPNTLHVDLNGYFSSSDGNLAVIRDNVLSHEDFLYRDGHIYLSVAYLREKLNKRFYYDREEKLLLYTQPTGTEEAGTDTLWDGVPVLTQEAEETYILLDYVARYTAVQWQVYENPLRLVMKTSFGNAGEVQTTAPAIIRTEASVTSPILAELETGERVHYLEEQAEWDYICTQDGILGYISKEELSEPELVETKAPYTEPKYDMPERDENILLIWQQVQVKAQNADLKDLLEKAQGVTVISPTWLFLNGSDGGFDSSADKSYVDTAHAMGLKVWALLNNMDNEIYRETLRKNFEVTSHRRRLIQGLLQTLKDCGADGINVDIESLGADAGPAFLQFIRELSVACHRAGLTVSVDNYVPSAWTRYYDRSEQAVFADYIVIMAYDEHYVGSEAGSTASLPFVVKGVEDTLQEVPASQIICGVPFFTRLWTGSSASPSSICVAMNEIPAYLEKYGLSPVWDINLGQSYTEFVLDGEPARLWIEDAESMTLRLDNLASYGLAGLAAWRLGMESDDIWQVFSQFFANNQSH